MTDRLTQIIGTARERLDRMDPDHRARIIDKAGSLDAARKVAWDDLPEDVRIGLVKAAGAVPAACGDDIAVAPARGPVRVVRTSAHYPKGDGGFEVKDAGHLGRAAMQVGDVFDVMRVQAMRKGGRLAMTPRQVEVARHYRALVERHEAGAVRCSSVEAMTGGGGGSADAFTQARLDSARMIDRMRARIGSGVAMAIRRVRPSDRGSRVQITDRVLVDMVCLGDRDISAVLRAHGWAVKGETVTAATKALAAALDRMSGHRPRADITVLRVGPTPCWPPQNDA